MCAPPCVVSCVEDINSHWHPTNSIPLRCLTHTNQPVCHCQVSHDVRLQSCDIRDASSYVSRDITVYVMWQTAAADHPPARPWPSHIQFAGLTPCTASNTDDGDHSTDACHAISVVSRHSAYISLHTIINILYKGILYNILSYIRTIYKGILYQRGDYI